MNKKCKKIVIIEDEKVTLKFLELSLVKLGYEIAASFDNGKDALSFIESNEFDLLLVDVELNGSKSGIDVVRKVNKIKEVPVIFMTSLADKKTILEVEKVFASEYILKPINIIKIYASIELAYNNYIYEKSLQKNIKFYHEIIESSNDFISRFNLYDGKISYVNNNFKKHFNLKEKDILTKSIFDLVPNFENIRKFLLLKKSEEDKEFEFENPEVINGEIVWFKYLFQPIISEEVEITEYLLRIININDEKKSKDEIESKSKALNERVKEINCLYKISKITEEQDKSIDEILSEIVDFIPTALRFPEIAFAIIEYKNKIYYSKNFIKAGVFISKDIIHDNLVGSVKLGYYDEKNNYLDLDVFLEEEKLLLSEIVLRIEKITERVTTKNELKKIQKEVVNIGENERKRVGQELHDGLGQLLTGISFLLKTSKNMVSKDLIDNNGLSCLEDSLKRIYEIDELVTESVETCRTIAKELTPSNFIQGSLIESIEQYVSRVRHIYNINCLFELKGIIDFDDFTSLQIFRIVQEAVNNGVKHANASCIKVSLTLIEDKVKLLIKDDGIGVDFDLSSNGMGLNIMKYRADLIGALFYAKNSDEKGFYICVEF